MSLHHYIAADRKVSAREARAIVNQMTPAEQRANTEAIRATGRPVPHVAPTRTAPVGASTLAEVIRARHARHLAELQRPQRPGV